MDPKARRTLLLELNRPRESFRTTMLKKSKENVKKKLNRRFRVKDVCQKVRENLPECSCSRELSRAFCTELFPFWGVIKKYSLRRYLLADFVAGMTVGIIHIPQGKLKPRLHYQSFLVQENWFKVFDAKFDSVNDQRKLRSKSIKELHPNFLETLTGIGQSN